MGIRLGNRLANLVGVGLYHQAAKKYRIYVDGEMMRYKGMIEENMTTENAEIAIAKGSFAYLNQLINTIEEHLSRRCIEVIVYMDGERVRNKVTNRKEYPFDSKVIRNTFVNLCKTRGFMVHLLKQGESELQMYLNRDQTSQLNAFVTSDSDMLSICYGHVPKYQEREVDVSPIEQVMPIKTREIRDNNFKYSVKNKLVVTDSCVWINPKKDALTFIGFDLLGDFDTLPFKVLAMLCGTDFTPSLITASMLESIFVATSEEKNIINSITDPLLLAAAFVYLGVKHRGRLCKLYGGLPSNYKDACANFQLMMVTYLEYINEGCMRDIVMPRPNMGVVSRCLLTFMGSGGFTIQKLQQWCKRVPLNCAIETISRQCNVAITTITMLPSSSSHIFTIEDDSE
jgi:hypothetical protein